MQCNIKKQTRVSNEYKKKLTKERQNCEKFENFLIR